MRGLLPGNSIRSTTRLICCGKKATLEVYLSENLFDMIQTEFPLCQTIAQRGCKYYLMLISCIYIKKNHFRKLMKEVLHRGTV